MRIDEIAELQRRLGEVLTSADSQQRWRELLPDYELDESGLRIATLLVAKLRFQRLISASRLAIEWFERDAQDFTESFRRYHHEVPARSLDPWSEAEAFERWCSGSEE